MRTFAQKENQPQERASSSRARSNPAAPGSHRADPILHLQRACPCGGGCPRCQKEHPSEEHERLQPKRLQAGNLGHTVAPPIVHEVLASPGQPLDSATRAFMEPRFGHDFSHVRVHTDTKAAESAEVVKARAYTVGQHVVLGEGQPSPQTIAGRQLWAHELAHMVQQSRGGPAPDLTSSAPHERDARAAAMAVATGRPRIRVMSSTGVGLARKDGEQPRSPVHPVAGGRTPVPVPKGTPYNFVAESPALHNWKSAVKGVLERAR